MRKLLSSLLTKIKTSKTKLSGLWNLSLGDVPYIGPVWRFVRRVWDWCVVTVKRGVAGFFSILTNPLEVTALIMVGVLAFVFGSQMGMSYMKWRVNVAVPASTTPIDTSSGWKEQALAAQNEVYRLRKAAESQKACPAPKDSEPVKCQPTVKYVAAKCPKPSFWRCIDQAAQ